jgi:hypothetical protein
MSEELDIIDAEIAPQQTGTLFRTDDPTEIVQRASGMASTLADVVRKQKLAVKIGGREHVRVEGWTLLGTMLGVFPVCEWTRKLDDGWEARVEARTMSGAVVGAAEAECLRSEKTWKSRDDYALRSMAQTRATSKALRQPLGFVMTLAGFDATPLEEMPPAGSDVPEPLRAEGPQTDPEREQLLDALTDLSKQLGLDLETVYGAVDRNWHAAPLGEHKEWLRRQVKTARENLDAKPTFEAPDTVQEKLAT